MTYTQSIEELQESTNSTIAKMDDPLRTVEIKLEGQGEKLQSQGDKLNKIDERLEKIDTNLNQRLDRIETNFDKRLENGNYI